MSNDVLDEQYLDDPIVDEQLVKDLGDNEISVGLPTKTLERNRYVLFCGDLIPDRVKTSNPLWKNGGINAGGWLTLEWNNGFLPQCEIIPLRLAYDSAPASAFSAEQRPHMVKAYVQSERGTDGKVHQRIIGNDDTLYRQPIFPASDIGLVTAEGNGIVEVPGIQNDRQMRAMQKFLFPEWETQRKEVHTWSNAKLQSYFESRLQAAETPLQSMVAESAIRSCVMYADWGNGQLNNAEAAMKEMAAIKAPYSYSAEAEMILKQLGKTRKDDLALSSNDSLQAFANAQMQQAETSAKELELRERELALREKEMAIYEAGLEAKRPATKAVDPPKTETKSETTEANGNPPKSEEVEAEPTCGDSGGKEGTCKIKTNLDADGRCQHHPVG